MKTRGASLLEAIVAIFLLTGGSLACFTLLIQAFRYQGKSNKLAGATLFAEQSLENVRLWALEPANFDSDWALYSDGVFTSPLYPRLECRITTSDLLATPRLTPGHRVVRAEVREGQRSMLSMSTQIATSLRFPLEPDPVRVTNLGGLNELDRNANCNFEAYMLDNNSRIIPGLRFQWDVVSVPPATPAARGTVETTSPNQALLTHVVYGPTPPDPNLQYFPGLVRVRASCRYRGKLYQTSSDPVELKSP